jgi:hypothetical protein
MSGAITSVYFYGKKRERIWHGIWDGHLIPLCFLAACLFPDDGLEQERQKVDYLSLLCPNVRSGQAV